MGKPDDLRSRIIQRSRKLRREETFPERLLWRYLRDRQVSGCKFRRQHPIPPYVADFFCQEAKLIIELDGHSHDRSGVADLKREEFLEGLGYHIVRFQNDEVIRNVLGVVQAIADALAECTERRIGNPHPCPSP